MDSLNTKHLGFIIVGVMVVSLKTYPSIFIRNGGRDTWLSMIVAAFIIILFMLFMLKAFSKGKSMVPIFFSAMGKPIGTVCICIFALALFATLVESAAVEANAMRTNMLQNTPIWFLILMFIPPAVYTVKKGKAAVLVVTIIAMVLVSISGMNLAVLTTKYKKTEYLLPILGNGITWGMGKAMIQMLGLFGCAAISFPYVKDLKETKKLVKHGMIAVLFVVQMEIVAMTGTIMTFEVDLVENMSYPKLLQTQLVDYFRFLESGELFVMLQIVGGWYIKHILTLYALLIVLKELNIKVKYLIYWISGFAFVAAYLAADNLFILFEFLEYYTYISLVGFVIIPLLVMIVFAARGYKVKECFVKK